MLRRIIKGFFYYPFLSTVTRFRYKIRERSRVMTEIEPIRD